MEALVNEQQKLSNNGTLSKSLEEIQKALDALVTARNNIAADPGTVHSNLAHVQNAVEGSLSKAHAALGQVRKHQTTYSKALDKKFKDKILPSTDYGALSSQPALINRAIAMHLLREGQFSVASTFLTEATQNPSVDAMTDDLDAHSSREQPLGINSLSDFLREQFANMYHILDEMKTKRNLLPAIEWARTKSDELDRRGSNLEFELGKLQFIWLFVGNPFSNRPPSVLEGRQQALEYARRELSHFRPRYLKELQQLCGAIAFSSNLEGSPYRRMFLNNDAFEELANSFTREFCSLLGLSADSPLYIAATAGAIALPTLLKLQTIMKEKRTEWTTPHELPVEMPLPPSYHFHSVFVCPVSKEQTTDQNPPMMMPCGHVVAKESLTRLSKNSRFKCPYCPSESHPRDAKEILM